MRRNYIIIPLITLAVAIVGNGLTSMGMDRYATLMLHPATPPGMVIGIVWTMIFIYTTIAALYAFKTLPKGETYNKVMILFIINAVLNVARSAIFFDAHLLRRAFGEMMLLQLTTVLLFIYMYRKAGLASRLLLPYIIRVFLASFFAYQTAILN
ncbi:MAG: TspO/MBR family protein [bacterium]